MRRLTLSTKALWHSWRAYRLSVRAVRLTAMAKRVVDKVDAHAAAAELGWRASKSLASVPSRRSTFNDPATWLLVILTGIFIAGAWLIICARAAGQ